MELLILIDIVTIYLLIGLVLFTVAYFTAIPDRDRENFRKKTAWARLEFFLIYLVLWLPALLKTYRED